MQYTDELDRMKARNKNGRKREYPRSQYMEEHQEELEERRVRRERQRRRRKRKHKIILCELLLLAVILAGAFFFFMKKGETGYWTVAVFGVDSRDGSLGKGSLSDVEMICSVNRETGEITLVSVYRDTYLKINQDGTYHKINEAYFKGGPEQAVAALNENLDLDIDNYATFNWKAVADTINILGGIDLEITEKEFKYINSFITETVNSTGIGSYQLEHAGMNHLDGVQAVAYARLRLMDTDFNRTERQRKVVMLAMEKAKQADWAVLNNILVTVLPQVSTDIGVGDLIPMARNISKYHIGETAGFPFAKTTSRIGKMDCVIPMTLESNVVQLHQVLYGEEAHTPSSAVKKISAKISEESGVYEEGTPAPSDKPVSGGSGETTQAPPATEPQTEPQTEPIQESSVEIIEVTDPSETDPEESTEEMEETESVEETESEEETESKEDETEEIAGPGANAEPTTEGLEKPTDSSLEDQQGPGAETEPGADA